MYLGNTCSKIRKKIILIKRTVHGEHRATESQEPLGEMPHFREMERKKGVALKPEIQSESPTLLLAIFPQLFKSSLHHDICMPILIEVNYVFEVVHLSIHQLDKDNMVFTHTLEYIYAINLSLQ